MGVTSFDPAIVAGVLTHMNGDHADDNLLIARAFGDRAAVRARMVGVDGDAGEWVYETDASQGAEHPLRVEWTAPISARPQIRREIVVLYDRACATLEIEPHAHD